MAKMSFTEVVRMMRKEYNVRVQRQAGEYRVNLVENYGKGHYFTNDINDAIETGKRMRAEARLSVYSVRFPEVYRNTIGLVDPTFSTEPMKAKHTTGYKVESSGTLVGSFDNRVDAFEFAKHYSDKRTMMSVQVWYRHVLGNRVYVCSYVDGRQWDNAVGKPVTTV